MEALKLVKTECNKPSVTGNREAWMQRFISFARREMFKQTADFMGERNSNGDPLPAHIIVTCGLPTTGFLPRSNRVNTTLGQYWHPSCNSQKAHLITVNPIINDSKRVFLILAHELCHAFEPTNGHHKHWQYAMKEICQIDHANTNGKSAMSEDFRRNADGTSWLEDQYKRFIKNNGHYPAAQVTHIPHKRQSTRMLKAECPSNRCDYYEAHVDGPVSQRRYKVRISSKVAEFATPICPVCRSQMDMEE